MSTKNLKWSLYNPKTEVQIDGLKLSQAQSIVANLNIKDLKEWKAWHEGQEKWHSISKFNELIEGNRTESTGPEKTETARTAKIAKAKQADAKETKLSFELADDELERTSLQILEGKTKESRLNSRFTRSYEVKIQLANMVFECRTLDISLGGMRIDRSLPASTNNALLTCELSRGSKKISLPCLVIPDPKAKTSCRLMIRKLKDPQNLRSFLLEG